MDEFLFLLEGKSQVKCQYYSISFKALLLLLLLLEGSSEKAKAPSPVDPTIGVMLFLGTPTIEGKQEYESKSPHTPFTLYRK